MQRKRFQKCFCCFVIKILVTKPLVVFCSVTCVAIGKTISLIMEHSGPTYLSESQVKSVLSWPLVNEAVEQALIAASTENCSQPARTYTFTENKNGVLLSMPGFVGDYSLNNKKYSTLGCKLVTSFKGNSQRADPLPNILANIILFDSTIGQLKCIIAATEITAWRTASASIVATKYLYFGRNPESSKNRILGIIGCGVQGRIHAVGMCNTFEFSEIKLYNRDKVKAEQLAKELDQLRDQFKNKNIKIFVANSIQTCVENTDIIVTGTFATEPYLHLDMLKSDVHINAVGAGENHHSELSEEIYLKAQVYVDNWNGAKSELKNLKADILGEVGQVISCKKPLPNRGISIFQSMGMAAEDATVAQAVFETFKTTNQSI